MMNRFREPVSGFTHLLGVLLAALGLIWLLTITYPDINRVLVSLIYGFSTILTFAASTIMHLYTGNKRTLRWLIRFDHAMIYIMIAGTYTPVAYLFLDTVWFWGLMLSIWGMAFGGVVWKLFFWHKDTIWSLAYYIAMGWFSLLLLPRLLPYIDLVGFLLLLSGGLMYTIGAMIYGIKRPNFNQWWGYHEIWHLFVLAGASLHFFGVIHYIA
jgi:hemolysin III